MNNYLNNYVVSYNDITCVLVNLGSAIRIAEKNGNLLPIKKAYEQLMDYRDKMTTSEQVTSGYIEYLKKSAEEEAKQSQLLKWEDTPNMVADYPIILKDVDSHETYLHFGRRKIKVSDIVNMGE